MDDTQTYIRMYCEGGNPVSVPGVGGKTDPGKKKINCSRHLEVEMQTAESRVQHQAHKALKYEPGYYSAVLTVGYKVVLSFLTFAFCLLRIETNDLLHV